MRFIAAVSSVFLLFLGGISGRAQSPARMSDRVWSEKWTLGLSRLIRREWEKATRGVRAILRPLESMPKEMSVGIFELEQAYGCPPQSVRG